MDRPCSDDRLVLNANFIDLDTWMIGSTAVRQPKPLLAPGKRRPKEPIDHALARSRSSLTIKIHLGCDANRTPLRYLLSSGQASDITHAQPLLNQVRIPGKSGRPRKRCRWLLADKGYDADRIRHYCGPYRMQPVIPQRPIKRRPKPGLPRLCDRPKCGSATSSSVCLDR